MPDDPRQCWDYIIKAAQKQLLNLSLDTNPPPGTLPAPPPPQEDNPYNGFYIEGRVIVENPPKDLKDHLEQAGDHYYTTHSFRKADGSGLDEREAGEVARGLLKAWDHLPDGW